MENSIGGQVCGGIAPSLRFCKLGYISVSNMIGLAKNRKSGSDHGKCL